MAIIIKSKNIYGDIENKKIVDNEITKINYSENIVSKNSDVTLLSAIFSGYSTDEIAAYGAALKALTDEQITSRNSSFEFIKQVSITSGNTHHKVAIFKYSISLSSPLNTSTPPICEYNAIVYWRRFSAYDMSSGNLGEFSKVNISGMQGSISYYNDYNAFESNIDLNTGLLCGIMQDEITSSSAVIYFAIQYNHQRSYKEKPAFGTAAITYTEQELVNSLTFNIKVGNFTISNISLSVGDGDYDFALQSNELMQSSTTITVNSGTKKSTEYLANKILNKWTKGKETAKLLLEYGEYYDTDGNLAKSIIDDNLPMQFKNGDIVRPYKATPTGDKPMSEYDNGVPKDFIVVGVERIFDGACWQKVTLLEN